MKPQHELWISHGGLFITVHISSNYWKPTRRHQQLHTSATRILSIIRRRPKLPSITHIYCESSKSSPVNRLPHTVIHTSTHRHPVRWKSQRQMQHSMCQTWQPSPTSFRKLRAPSSHDIPIRAKGWHFIRRKSPTMASPTITIIKAITTASIKLSPRRRKLSTLEYRRMHSTIWRPSCRPRRRFKFSGWYHKCRDLD